MYDNARDAWLDAVAVLEAAAKPELLDVRYMIANSPDVAMLATLVAQHAGEIMRELDHDELTEAFAALRSRLE